MLSGGQVPAADQWAKSPRSRLNSVTSRRVQQHSRAVTGVDGGTVIALTDLPSKLERICVANQL